jgi:hypothetical protein
VIPSDAGRMSGAAHRPSRLERSRVRSRDGGCAQRTQASLQALAGDGLVFLDTRTFECMCVQE